MLFVSNRLTGFSNKSTCCGTNKGICQKCKRHEITTNTKNELNRLKRLQFFNIHSAMFVKFSSLETKNFFDENAEGSV